MSLGKRFAIGEVDKVVLIYHHFKSAGSQILTTKTFLPIDIESELERDHERDLTTNVVTKKAQEYLKAKGQDALNFSFGYIWRYSIFCCQPFST
jgi:F-type H+-transporting ATPase subunit gamma